MSYLPQAGSYGDAALRYSSALRYVGQETFSDPGAVSEEQRDALEKAVVSCLLNRWVKA